MPNELLTPVQIARVALVRLSSKAVPPTPENYRRYYNEVAGITSEKPETVNESEQQVIGSASLIVNDVAETTTQLLEALEGHNGELHSSIQTLRDQDPEHNLLAAVNEILRTAIAMHQSVDSSHGELRLMRDSLQEIRKEIAEHHPVPEHDTLTGARSRYALDGILRHTIARTRRYQSALSVAMFDLDNFHHINDEFGAAVGDRMLGHVGEITRSSLRDSDVFIRYGGEEFLILMPETQAPGAQFVLNRLQLVLQKNPLVHNGQKLNCTFSAGVAELTNTESHSEIVARSLLAMQTAKCNGRNQIVLADNKNAL